jgi:hypothetical protein
MATMQHKILPLHTALFAQIGDSNYKCSSSFEVEYLNEDETQAVHQSPTQ